MLKTCEHCTTRTMCENTGFCQKGYRELSKEEIEHDDMMHEMHKEIRGVLRKHGFEYATGSYAGFDKTKMNFQSYGDTITVSVEFKSGEQSKPPKSR